jgi:hypothetical protein
MKTFNVPYPKLPKEGLVPIDEVHGVFGQHLIYTLDSTHIWFPSIPTDPNQPGAQLFAYGVNVWSANSVHLAPHDQSSPPTYPQPLVVASAVAKANQFFVYKFYVESVPQPGDKTATWNYVVTLGQVGTTLGSFSVGPGPSVLPVNFTCPSSGVPASGVWSQLVLSLVPSDKTWLFLKCEIYK